MRTIGSLIFVAAICLSQNALARWQCDVQNKIGGHWTFAAPTQGEARTMAKQACDANSYNPANCNPVCSQGSRWRCDVANKKGQFWTFYAPDQVTAYKMAKNHCDLNSWNSANCQPSCMPD